MNPYRVKTQRIRGSLRRLALPRYRVTLKRNGHLLAVQDHLLAASARRTAATWGEQHGTRPL